MDSIVIELQRDSLDRGIHITDLLRKALLVSRKLKIKDIEQWIDSELNGYKTKKIPDYRIVYGEVKAFNPYRGWIPVMVPDPKWSDMLRSQNIYLSVSQIEDLARNTKKGSFIAKYSSQQANIIMNLMGEDFEPALHIPTHQLIRIIDVTKTKIMDFALDLESRGIMGEGLMFSTKEQKLAENITNNTIYIETMVNSTLQQDTIKSKQKK